MKKSVCPICGQPSVEGLCKRCLLESTDLLSCPGAIEVTICQVCGSELLQGKWVPQDSPTEELVTDAASKAIGVHRDLLNPKMTLSLHQLSPSRYSVHVTLGGEFAGQAAWEECKIHVKVRRTTCDRCSRISGNYYEAIVQLRAAERALTESEIDQSLLIADTLAERSRKRGDQLGFIQKIEDTRGGLDIVVGSLKLGRQIGRAVIERFGGRIKESHKLTGRKDGKDLYRTNISVRLPRFVTGDLVEYEGEILEVKGSDGRNTICRGLTNGCRRLISDEDTKTAQVLGNRSNAEKCVVIAKDESVVEILDPESYRTAFIARPKVFDEEVGGEVLVLRTGKGLIMLQQQ